ISGMIDSYLEAYTAGDTTVTRLSSGGANGGSRVTFSGTEEMNGGLTAFFRLEMGILNDEGISTGNNPNYLFERETVVGVRGNFGSISFGRQYTPHFMSLPMNEPTGQSLGGAIGAFGVPGHVSTNGIGLSSGGAPLATTRMDNSLVYSTPTMAGLTTTFMAAFGEQTYQDNGVEKPSNARGNFYNLGFRYVNGPFTSNLSFAKWNNPKIGAKTLDDVWFESFSAAYDFNVTKLNVIVTARQSDDIEVPNLWAAELGSLTPMLGGALAVTVGYLTNCDQEKGDALSWGIRYDYPLSKSTKVYAGVFGVQNEDNAKFVLAGGGGSSMPPAFAKEEAGLANNTVFVGLNHRF
ncbi:MAG: porin, partial [Sutterellaceae bacterium]|nr:porin [Sutterellaceae bacterium]